MYIAEYFYGSYNNHSSRRDRKLLLTHKEIQKIERAAKESGFSIIPTRVFINEKGLAKVVIAIAKGKKNTISEIRLRRERINGKWIECLSVSRSLADN